MSFAHTLNDGQEEYQKTEAPLPCGERMMSGSRRVNVYCVLDVAHEGNHQAFVQWDALGNVSQGVKPRGPMKRFYEGVFDGV